MKRICLCLIWVMLVLMGCSGKGNNNQQGETLQQPQNTSTSAPAPAPGEQQEDFSMTTTLPDGTKRIEARVLEILDDTTLKIKSVNGEETLKLSEKTGSHVKILGIKEQSKIIATLKDGVADTIELVTGE